MYTNLWGFLSVMVLLGVPFAMLLVWTTHKRIMKRLEIEAMKAGLENARAGSAKPADNPGQGGLR